MTSAIPFHGVAPFLLGMRREQIESLAGKPDAFSNESFLDDVNQESWRYEAPGVVLDFTEEDDWRLATITVESREVDIKGVHVVGQAQEELMSAATAACIHDLVLTDDFEESGVCYESDACGLMVWVANGVVVNFTLFPKYDETGEHPLWPAS